MKPSITCCRGAHGLPFKTTVECSHFLQAHTSPSWTVDSQMLHLLDRSKNGLLHLPSCSTWVLLYAPLHVQMDYNQLDSCFFFFFRWTCCLKLDGSCCVAMGRELHLHFNYSLLPKENCDVCCHVLVQLNA